MTKRGYVYVLTNPAFPQLVKIGRTTRDPCFRAQEISRTTGVPRPYGVAYKRAFADCVAAENAIHSKLKNHRLPNREHFEIDLKTAIEIIQNYQPPGATVRDQRVPKRQHFDIKDKQALQVIEDYIPPWERFRGKRARKAKPARRRLLVGLGFLLLAVALVWNAILKQPRQQDPLPIMLPDSYAESDPPETAGSSDPVVELPQVTITAVNTPSTGEQYAEGASQSHQVLEVIHEVALPEPRAQADSSYEEEPAEEELVVEQRYSGAAGITREEELATLLNRRALIQMEIDENDRVETEKNLGEEAQEVCDESDIHEEVEDNVASTFFADDQPQPGLELTEKN